MLLLPQACRQPHSHSTKKVLQKVAVLVTLQTLGHAIQTGYFVTPNESTLCPGFPCHTLSHYLKNTTQYFTSNTRLSFLHGVHKVNKSGQLWFKIVSNLTLTGYIVSSSHAAKTICIKPAVLTFRNVANLAMKHLSILYCGYPILVCKNKFASVALFLMNITSLKLSDISVENSTGYGLFGINVLGNSSISHSRFMFNNYYTLNSTANCSYGLRSCQGGNIQLRYQNLYSW